MFLESFFACDHCIFIVVIIQMVQVIPRQLCDNAGFDATDVLNKLRQKHASGKLITLKHEPVHLLVL